MRLNETKCLVFPTKFLAIQEFKVWPKNILKFILTQCNVVLTIFYL